MKKSHTKVWLNEIFFLLCLFKALILNRITHAAVMCCEKSLSKKVRGYLI
jgi:hypothetical protein